MQANSNRLFPCRGQLGVTPPVTSIPQLHSTPTHKEPTFPVSRPLSHLWDLSLQAPAPEAGRKMLLGLHHAKCYLGQRPSPVPHKVVHLQTRTGWTSVEPNFIPLIAILTGITGMATEGISSCVLSHIWLFVTLCTVASRLLCPWDSPGNNSGTGCHFLLSKGSSWTRNQTCISCIGRWILYHSAIREAYLISYSLN